MQNEHLDRFQELLRVASRLSAATWRTFLERAELRRRDLRTEVLSLLEHDSGREELCAPTLGVPATLGLYELLDGLGEAPPARLFRIRVGQDAQRPVVIAVAGPGPAALRIAETLRV